MEDHFQPPLLGPWTDTGLAGCCHGNLNLLLSSVLGHRYSWSLHTSPAHRGSGWNLQVEGCVGVIGLNPDHIRFLSPASGQSHRSPLVLILGGCPSSLSLPCGPSLKVAAHPFVALGFWNRPLPRSPGLYPGPGGDPARVSSNWTGSLGKLSVPVSTTACLQAFLLQGSAFSSLK